MTPKDTTLEDYVKQLEARNNELEDVVFKINYENVDLRRFLKTSLHVHWVVDGDEKHIIGRVGWVPVLHLMRIDEVTKLHSTWNAHSRIGINAGDICFKASDLEDAKIKAIKWFASQEICSKTDKEKENPQC